MKRFIVKHTSQLRKPLKHKMHNVMPKDVNAQKNILSSVKDNTEIKSEEVMMDTKEKIAMASAILEADTATKAKRIKKDKGLIEKVESSTIVLTEDNKELLKD